MISQKPRIAIATSGRFHVLDLARELDLLEHTVRFYSHVTQRRAVSFGLPTECHVGLLPFVAPLLVWQYGAPSVAPNVQERFIYGALNAGVSMRLQPCDIFICMSGMYLEAARAAKRRFGARIWLERGSRHILCQDRILASIPGAERPSSLTIDRELDGYALADRISVPSTNVEESFRGDELAHSKLFVNPYGVDLDMFPLGSARVRREPFTFLFVGRWSLRKGCDLLTAAIRRIEGVRLFHVGSIGDLTFPHADKQFHHIDAVPQWELKKLYALSDALVLASREEGLSVVLAQALASGLPIICTDRTGGRDLAHNPGLSQRITVVPHDDIDALSSAMVVCCDRGNEMPPLDKKDRAALSWAAYAKRYSDEISRDLC